MSRLTAVLVALLALALPCSAAVNRWDSLGLNSTLSSQGQGSVTNSHIAIDPGNPSTIYVGNERGVWKSSDGGSNWVLAFQDAFGGIPPGVRPVLGLEMERGDSSTLFAVTTDSIQRTRNGGTTWSPVLVSPGISALSPILPGAAMYACLIDTLNGPRYSVKSDDRGTTWARIPGLEGKTILAFAIDPADPSRVWAAVSLDPQGAAIYASADGGTTWEARSDGIPTLRSTDLVVDPDTPGTLYLATADAGVYRTEDGGASWVPASEGLPAAEIVDIVAGAGSSVYAATFQDGVYRSDDGGAHWLPAGFRGTRVGGLGLDSGSRTLYAGVVEGLLRITWEPVPACTTGAESLCLQDDRFLVESSWRTRNDSGVGQAVPLTSDTGYFWFFAPENVELTLKVLDGRTTNGNFWVFFGALSNVEYAITVTDTVTGAVQSYFNIQSVLASVADTSAFAGDSSPASLARRSSRTVARPALAEVCTPGTYALCLNDGRFRVEVFFTRTPGGPTLPAPATPITSDTGYLWFFDDANVEIVVKVLDGRSVNGHFWVFYGALSNVEYSLIVTDTQTGAQRTYVNERGTLASVADTSAF